MDKDPGLLFKKLNLTNTPKKELKQLLNKTTLFLLTFKVERLIKDSFHGQSWVLMFPSNLGGIFKQKH